MAPVTNLQNNLTCTDGFNIAKGWEFFKKLIRSAAPSRILELQKNQKNKILFYKSGPWLLVYQVIEISNQMEVNGHFSNFEQKKNI